MYFLDNASTTRCLEESAKIVYNASINDYFNPSAKYKLALDMQNKLNECREVIKSTLGAINYNVVFTASATESNNMVLKSMLSKNYTSLISVGEHSSIYETAKSLALAGCKVEHLNLQQDGTLDFEDFKTKMTKEVGFVSLILVSNETGAINNAKKIITYAKSKNPKVVFHLDAVQGYLKVDIDLEDLEADYLTISSHKICGPKGVGALVYKKNAKLNGEILGGGQENGKRSGTENLPSILGFANSAKVMHDNLEENYNLVKNFKLSLFHKLQQEAMQNGVEMILNGSLENSSPYILSVSFPKKKAEIILHKLEDYEIYVGTGSACSSKHSGNRVLSGMGKNDSEVEGNLRLSFEIETTKLDTNFIAEKIIEVAKNIKTK